MSIKQSGKRLRVPWRKKLDENDLPVTLPVFMAYCAVAGAQWSDKNFRHEAEALRDERAILFASPSYQIQEDDRLLSDAVVPLGTRTASSQDDHPLTTFEPVEACNHPDLLDSAIKRPGRLNRHIAVPLPDAGSRRSILEFHSGLTMCAADYEMFDLATEGQSGADIERLVRDARRVARRESRDLNSEHIVSNLRPLIKLPGAYLRALAIHEAGHAVVSFEVVHSPISCIKISRYKVDGETRELGYVEYQPSAPQRRTRQFFENAIATFLGGIAAELEVYGSFTDGAGGADGADLNRATDLATALEGSLGMGHTLVAGNFEQGDSSNLRLYLPELRREVHDILETQLTRARATIRSQRPALDAVADRLLEAGELAGAEVREIIGYHRRTIIVSLAKTPQRAGM
jgi:ATP-dependent metalloprotease